MTDKIQQEIEAYDKFVAESYERYFKPQVSEKEREKIISSYAEENEKLKRKIKMAIEILIVTFNHCNDYETQKIINTIVEVLK